MTLTELKQHVERQIENILCYQMDTAPYINEAVVRTMNCLCHSSNKYVSLPQDDWREEIPFSVYNSLHYCIFLYHISKVAYEKDKNGTAAEKFYYLNKIMHSVDCSMQSICPRSGTPSTHWAQ